MGHMQTVQVQIRRHKTWRLIRVSNVCLQDVQLKFEKKPSITLKLKWTGSTDKEGNMGYSCTGCPKRYETFLNLNKSPTFKFGIPKCAKI